MGKLCYGEMIGWRAGNGYPLAIDFQFSNVQTMKRKQNRAAAHARESGRCPADSIAAQFKVIRKYAKQRGLKIVNTATDHGT